MMRAIRRLAPLAATGVLAILVAGPATAGSGGVNPDAAGLSVRQSVLTELSATGEPGTSRVFTQVASDARGAVTLPAQSTAALRGLSGFSRPSVEGEAVTWDFDGPGLRRSVADNAAGVPVTFDITYTLDGEPIDPADLVGESGELTVAYTVRNTSGQPTEVEYVDGRGNPRTKVMDVPIPFVGSMSTVLDDRFGEVAAPGAAVVGDGRGNTVVNWSLVLFAPLGADEQVVSYSARVRDAIVAPTSAQVIPVTSRSFGSMASASETYAGAAESTTALTDGAGEIHANLKTLANGAGQLMNGLNALAAGAGKLSTGLGDAASGSQELSAGMGKAADGGAKLADGLGDLEDGAGQLSAGLDQAAAGGGELDAGLGALADGAGALSAGLSQARGGASELALGLAALDAGAAKLGAGAGVLAAGAKELDTKTGELVAGTKQLSAGAGKLVGGLDTLKKSLNASDGLPAAQSGIGQISGGVSKVIAGIGTTSTAGTLLNGLFQISGGLSNPGALAVNPTCDPAAGAADPTKRCGVKEVLFLLQLGTNNPTVATDVHGLPVCTDPTNPCGADQAVTLLEGGLGQVKTGAGDLESGAAQLGVGVGGAIRPGIEGIQTSASALGPVATALEIAVLAVAADAALGGLAPATQAAVTGAVPYATGATVSTGLAGIATGAGGLVAGLGTPYAPGTGDDVCADATADRAAIGVGTVPVLLALKLLECGAASVQDGVGAAGATGTLLDGTDQLRTGVARSTAALVSLQAAIGDPATLDTLVNGVARVMMGLDNAAAFVPGAGYNPACASTAGLQPCGAKQGLQLVQGGLGELSGGLSGALSKINTGLGSVTVPGETLLYGAGSLAAGAGELSTGAGRLRNEGTKPLAAGAGELAAGAGQLADGAAAASAGGQQLAGGLGQLDDGAKELAAGATKAKDGTSALVNGLGQLADGGSKLTAGAGTAAAGAGELSSGLGQLDEGAGQLAAGLVTAADGSGTLAENLVKAADGGDKIADGSQQLLYEGTRVMADAVNDAAADTGLTVAHLAAADQRGQAEGLPYGVPEGASASAVYSFEIAGVEGTEGLSEPGRAATAAGLFGATAGLGLFGRRRFGLI